MQVDQAIMALSLQLAETAIERDEARQEVAALKIKLADAEAAKAPKQRARAR